jgi:hypothetical protein
LLTQRAAATLLCYTYETNQNMAQWLNGFLAAVRHTQSERSRHTHEVAPRLNAPRRLPRRAQNPIPRNGTWTEVSGDDMLRKLLCMVRACSAPHAHATDKPRCLIAEALITRPCCLLPRPAQDTQVLENPYTGDRLAIDPRNLAQRILDVREFCIRELTKGL